ncbi:MAG: hypothetical protein NT103_08900 [Campylobacterales bacterium]|nr:hypothetical protein [Campylobacterales bacterium]
MKSIMTYQEALRQALQEAMEYNKPETEITDIINEAVPLYENSILESNEDLEKNIYFSKVAQ